jgi:hypothetical protein
LCRKFLVRFLKQLSHVVDQFFRCCDFPSFSLNVCDYFCDYSNFSFNYLTKNWPHQKTFL